MSECQKCEQLRQTLSNLYNEQNGPPLVERQKRWENAMDMAAILLGHRRDSKITINA